MLDQMVQQEEERMRKMGEWLDKMAAQHETLSEQSRAQKDEIEARYQAMLKEALERQEQRAKQHEAMRKRAEERRAEIQAEMERLESMSPEELRAYFIEKHHERQLEHRRPEWMGSRMMSPPGQMPMEPQPSMMQAPMMGRMPMGQMPMGRQTPSGMPASRTNVPQAQGPMSRQGYQGGFRPQGYPIGQGFGSQAVQPGTPSAMAPQRGPTGPGYYRGPMGNPGMGYPSAGRGPWGSGGR